MNAIARVHSAIRPAKITGSSAASPFRIARSTVSPPCADMNTRGNARLLRVEPTARC